MAEQVARGVATVDGVGEVVAVGAELRELNLNWLLVGRPSKVFEVLELSAANDD
jgi:hypothetical protein